MNEEINTVSEEQVLHNKLSFEINQELIHLMKRIVELQQENARLKDKIEKVIEYVNHYESIKGYYEYEECGYDEYNYEEDLKEELLEILKEN